MSTFLAWTRAVFALVGLTFRIALLRRVPAR